MRKKDQRRLKRDLKKNHSSKLEQFDVEEAPSFDPPPSKASKALFWKKI
jgi:hypothetical protein